VPRRHRPPRPQLHRASSTAARAYDRADDIVAERDALAAEVRRLQEMLGSSARFCAKARDLLTRSWSRADWSGREDLVKAARWLVQLETMEASARG
jgi:hypothetical protein